MRGSIFAVRARPLSRTLSRSFGRANAPLRPSASSAIRRPAAIVDLRGREPAGSRRGCHPGVADGSLYGGVAIPGDRVGALKVAIGGLRTGLNVPRDHLLKFNPGPQGMSHEDFKRLKGGLLEVAATHGARLLVHLVHHKIVQRGDVQAARRMAINTPGYHFDCRGQPSSISGRSGRSERRALYAASSTNHTA